MGREPYAVATTSLMNIAVIVAARPDHTALAADHAGRDIVDQGVEILESSGLKRLCVFRVVTSWKMSLKRWS